MKLTEQHMQCATCSRYFSGLTNFDRHRTKDYENDSAPRCADPAAVGLELRGGLWRGPAMTDEQKRKLGWKAQATPSA